MRETKESIQKIRDLQQTVEKANNRYNIVNQTLQYLSYKEKDGHPVKVLEGITLPATQWYFENLAINAIKQAVGLRKIPLVKFHGIEATKGRANLALKNLPPNCDITGCTYDEFFKKDNYVSKSGVSVLKEQDRPLPLMINFSWADYCWTVNFKAMESFAKMIGMNFDEGLAYITFSIKSRKKGKSNKNLLMECRGLCRSKNIRDGVRTSINRLLNQYARDKNVRCIYDVVYGGGSKGNTTMITLGYSVNVPENAIQSIRANHMEENNEFRKGNYQAYLHMKSRKSWGLGNMGRPKVEKTPERIRLDMAVWRWEPKWKSLKSNPEKKIKIASKYGVTVHQFGSMVAHYHGKLGEKRNGKITQDAQKLAA